MMSDIVELSARAWVQNGKTPSRSEQKDSGVPVLKIKDISESGDFVGSFDSFVDEAFAEQYSSRRIKTGDILILNAAHNADYVGSKIYRCTLDVEGAIATGEWLMIRPVPKRLDPDFAYFWCTSGKINRCIRDMVKGIHLYPKDVGRLPLPELELDEQKHIAAILDKADTIRRKRAKTLQLTKDFLRSTFLEMFGDPMTNPKGWPIHRLGDHLTFVTSGSRGWAQYYASTGARFLRSLDVQMNHISDSDAVFVNPPDSAETRRTLVRPNDVLLTITGSRIGRVAPVDSSVGEAYISQHVAILRLNDSIRPPFLSMFLSEARGGQHQIRRMQYGQTKPGLNLEQLRAFEIPCPLLPMQDQFCSIWNKFDVHTQHHALAEQQTENLFNSLVQRAFRGEL